MINKFDTGPRSFVPDRYDFKIKGARLEGTKLCCSNCGRLFYTFYNEASIERVYQMAHLKSYHKRCRSCGVEIDWSGFNFGAEE